MKNSVITLLIASFLLYFMPACQSEQHSNIKLTEPSPVVYNENKHNFTHIADFGLPKSSGVETVKILQNTSVLIKVPIGKDGVQTATGVLTKRGGKVYVWTVAHTFESQPTVKITPEELKKRFEEGRPPIAPVKKLGKVGDYAKVTIRYKKGYHIYYVTSDAFVIAISDSGSEDLAILELTVPSKLILSPSVMWYNEPIEEGLDVYHIGNMHGDFMWSASKGIVSYGYREVRRKSFFQTDHIAVPGSSGGGVFEADTKKCLGLMVWINIPGINFGAPFDRIKKFAASRGYLWLYDNNLPIPEKMPDGHPNIVVNKNQIKAVEESLQQFKELTR